ncbi:MAG: hypothetical protein ACYTFK_11135 [Planctomycetota bacterium]
MTIAVLACFAVSLIFACGCSGEIDHEEANAVSIDEAMGAYMGVFEISRVNMAYINKKDRLPDSIEDLKNFCSEPKTQCPQMDWSVYKLHRSADDPNNVVEILIQIPGTPDPVTITIHKDPGKIPKDQKTQNLMEQTMLNSLEETLGQSGNSPDSETKP